MKSYYKETAGCQTHVCTSFELTYPLAKTTLCTGITRPKEMRVKSCTLVGFDNAISFILLGFAGYRDVQRLGGYPGERLRFLATVAIMQLQL